MDPVSKLTLRQDSHDPSRTVMLFDGKAVASIPWQACDAIADSFRRAARAGEEQAKANVIIQHQALLTRSGAPFGLSNNRKIQDAAHVAAQWDSKVRKAMPLASVPSAAHVGTPTLIKHRAIGAKS